MKRNLFLSFNFLLLIFLFSCNSKDKEHNKISSKFLPNIYNDSLFVYMTIDSLLIVEDITNKKEIFKKKINSYLCNSIIDKQNNLFYISNDSTVYSINLKTHKKNWNFHASAIVNNFYVQENLVFLSIKDSGITTLNKYVGKVVYDIKDVFLSSSASSLIYNIVFTKDLFFVTNFQSNTITAFRFSDGKKMWKYNSKSSGFSKCLTYKNILFCGITGNPNKREGKVLLLDISSGNVIFEINKMFDLICNPFVYKNKIIYYTYDNKLNELNIDKFRSKAIYKFKRNNGLCGNNFFLIDDHVYFEDCQFNIQNFNLVSYKLEIKKRQFSKRLNLVYKNRNRIVFVQ